MTELPTTGERLRSRRRALNITAEELGRRAAMIMGRDKPISASAVRNQENGTNGLPMAVAEAYAEVLKVNAQWLLFGDRDLSPVPSDRDEYEAEQKRITSEGALEIDDIRISTFGIVSGRWLPEMVKPDHTEEDNDLWLYIPGWSRDGNAGLSAFEVADNSLDPVFPKGTLLVAANHRDAILNDGTIVIANRVRGGEVQQSVRMLKAIRNGDVDLVGLGATPLKPEPLLRNEVLDDVNYVSHAVITSVRFLPGGTGRPLDARTPFEPDYFAPGNEEKAAEILAEAERIVAARARRAAEGETTE